MSSSVHMESLLNDHKKAEEFFEILQEAVYGKVGLLASHETRLVLLYLRVGCREVMEEKILFSELRLRLWALHVALKSDLGVPQPMWKNVVEKVHADWSKREQQTVSELVNSPPWDNLYSNTREVKDHTKIGISKS